MMAVMIGVGGRDWCGRTGLVRADAIGEGGRDW